MEHLPSMQADFYQQLTKQYGENVAKQLVDIYVDVEKGDTNQLVDKINNLSGETEAKTNEIRAMASAWWADRIEDAGYWDQALQFVGYLPYKDQEKLIQRVRGRMLTGEITQADLDNALNQEGCETAKKRFQELAEDLKSIEFDDSESPPGSPKAETEGPDSPRSEEN